jgi:phosphatidylinositol alpha-1,6-mannosyltransferase
MKTVALLTPFYWPDNHGGAVKVYESLLCNRDFNVHVICPQSSEEMNDDQYRNEKGITIHRVSPMHFNFLSKNPIVRLKEFFLYQYRLKKEIQTALDDIQPDIVVNGGIRWLGWLNQSLFNSYNLINYVHGEELTIPPVGIVGKWFWKTQNQSLAIAKTNICVSSVTEKNLLDLVPSANCTVLTNFVDINYFKPSTDKQALRQDLGYGSEVRVIALARLIARKGIDDLISAVKNIVAEGFTDFHLDICGTGPDLDKLKRQVSESVLTEHVTFHGYTKDEKLLSLLQGADIFAMPNKTVNGDLEGFGLVFLEANACGLPVIGGKSGGVVDAIEDGVSGYLIQPGSISDIQHTLKRLIDDEDLRTRLGASALSRAIDSYSLERKRSEFDTILNHCIDDGIEPGVIRAL